MRRDDDDFLFVHTAQFADDVARLVDLHRQSGFGQQIFDGRGALRFLIRRRGDFRDVCLLVVDPENIGSEPIESGADSYVFRKP